MQKTGSETDSEQFNRTANACPGQAACGLAVQREGFPGEKAGGGCYTRAPQGFLIKKKPANATGFLSQQHLMNRGVFRISPRSAFSAELQRESSPGPSRQGRAGPPPLTAVTASGGARGAEGARSPHGRRPPRLAEGEPARPRPVATGARRAPVTYLSKLKHYISCAGSGLQKPRFS